MFQSVVLLQLLLLNPIQGLQHLIQGVSTVVSVCLGWRLPDWMPSRRNQPIQTKQVKIGLSFLLFLLKRLWGGAGFYICWFTCPGSPEHEKLMTKCWKDIMVTSCGVGERKLVLMLMDFAMLIKLWKPRPCQDVRVCWTGVKHWAFISCSCMLRVSSFSSFTDVFFSSFWLVWCRYKTTKPWEFLQREPSVSICFRVISWQWCLPVNRSHKFKEGRKKKKKTDLAGFIGLHIYNNSEILEIIDIDIELFWYSLWNLSLCCDLSHLGKRVPCYWWHKCSGTVKPKCDLAFFGFWQSLLPWGGQLNSLKNILTVSKTVAENTLEAPAHDQTEKVSDAWQSVASCGLALTRTHETTINMILVTRGWVGAQKPKDNAVTATEKL